MRQGEKRGSEERNIAKLHSCGTLCWKGLIVKNNTTKVFKCVCSVPKPPSEGFSRARLPSFLTFHF